MIPLYKLEELPRTQKLRKLAKIFTMAENRLCLTVNVNKTDDTNKSAKEWQTIYSEKEIVFFFDAASLLSNDSKFHDDAKNIFFEAIKTFSIAIKIITKADGTDKLDINNDRFRRILNKLRHILLSETGKDQADWDFIGEDGLLDPDKRQIFKGMWVYMEDIRSPFNVGAMFRSAESFGAEKIILSPFCADPKHKRAERTAMGCIDIIPWERQELFPAAANTALNANVNISVNNALPYPVFALETGGIPLSEFNFPDKGILITGSEELGVSPQALAAADASLGRVSIPCYGSKASLNVSVAFGIAMQAWAAKLKK